MARMPNRQHDAKCEGGFRAEGWPGQANGLFVTNMIYACPGEGWERAQR